jgi:nucleotide-binding universal stress UspA family protein
MMLFIMLHQEGVTMVQFWRAKTRDDIDGGKAAPTVGATGDIAVIVDGKKLDNELVRLACFMAKKAKRKVHIVHIIEVPRTLPLHANIRTKESEAADKLLQEALAIAGEGGCDAVAEVVEARDAGPAIVDEARDHNCALIMIGMVRDAQNKIHGDFGKTVLYVLNNAPCRVWVVQDPKKPNG